MLNTSMGVHTFSFYQRVNEDSYFLLDSHFGKYMKETGLMNSYPIKKNGRIIGKQYTYKSSKGIRWLLLSNKVSDTLTLYGVMVVITPKVLIENNYVAVAKAADLETVEILFNDEAAKISPILRSFGLSSMNRGDPGLTIDLKELNYPCSPEQMITLIKRGDVPKHFTERKAYDDKDKSHRRKSDKNSFYLESGSVVINYYWKYPKQKEKHPNYQNREGSRNVIRFEVQCKYPKLYSVSKGLKCNSRYYKSFEEMSDDEIWNMIDNRISNPSIPIDVMLADNISADLISSYFNKIIRQGDYFTLDGARWMVEAHNFRPEKKERLIRTLELINDCRSVVKAKTTLYGEEVKEFKRSLRELDTIFVNPVTIPRGWKIEHIPNPLRAYYNHITEEQLVPKAEILFEKLLAEYLS